MKNNKRKYYWTMKDGTKINIDEMDKNHLRNVLKLLIRRSETEMKTDCFDEVNSGPEFWKY